MSVLSNIKTGNKLNLLVALNAAMLLCVVVAGFVGLGTINTKMDEGREVAAIELKAEEVKSLVNEIMMHVGIIAGLQDANARAREQKAIEDLRSTYVDNMTVIKQHVTTDEERRLVSDIESSITGVKDANNRAIELANAGKNTEAMVVFATEIGPKAEAIDESIQDFIDVQEKENTATDTAAEAAYASSRWLLAIACALAILLSFIMGFFTSRDLATPLALTRERLGEVAKGDLTHDVPERLRGRGDEIGDLGKSIQTMVVNLRDIVKGISGNTSTLSSSSEELSAASTQLAAAAEEMTAQSNTVASGAEQATANVNNISAAAEQMSSNVTTVATSIEEMSASISEVAKNCQKESQIAASADARAKATQDLMERLGSSAKEIGKVVEVINNIADQTNLLALNATIEAASAGDAGKGFAVVANEVKELAKQTAQATGEIGRQIEEMQASTTGAVKAIEEITQIIGEINMISQTIVSAVEEQSATTSEIARNVTGASAASAEIARAVGESAKGLTEVSSNIQGVNTAAQSTAQGVVQVKQSAGELAQLSAQLQQVVNRFRV